MFQKILNWYESLGLKEVVRDIETDQPVMIKWMLLGIKEPRKWFPFNIVIHNIPDNDLEDHKHNHPWPFVSIILKGGYWEHLDSGRYWRKPGKILFRSHKTRHRIEFDPSKPNVYTLYIMGPRLQDWTVFRDDKGKVVTGKNRYYTTEH